MVMKRWSLVVNKKSDSWTQDLHQYPLNRTCYISPYLLSTKFSKYSNHFFSYRPLNLVIMYLIVYIDRTLEKHICLGPHTPYSGSALCLAMKKFSEKPYCAHLNPSFHA